MVRYVYAVLGQGTVWAPNGHRTENELCKLLDCTPGDIILYEEDEVCEEVGSEES